MDSLLRAAELALTLAGAGDRDYRRLFHSLHSRLDEEDDRRGDAFHRALHRTSAALEVGTSKTDLGSAVRWHRDFSEKYPGSELWILLQHFIRNNINHYENVGDQRRLQASRKELEDIMDAQTGFWGQERGQHGTFASPAPMILPMPVFMESHSNSSTTGDDSTLSLQFYAEVAILKTFTDPAGVGISDTRALRGSVISTLMRWMQQDLLSGMLGVKEFKCIFGFRAIDIIDSLDEKLHHEHEYYLSDSNQGALIERLLGGRGCPVSVERWESTFGILESWLFDRSTYPESH